MKKFVKGFLAIACSFALGLSMFSCGAKEEAPAAENTDEATQDEEKASGEKIKVGFIYIGSINDGGFTQAHDAGRAYLEEQLDGQVETMYQENIPENATDIEAAAKAMIDSGANVIIGNSFGFMDALENLSKEFPDVKFLHFSGNKMNDTNFDNFFGAMEEPRYLSGIVAGLTTKTNKIGYVAAFPQTEIFIGINAFTLGARSVNPDAQVNVVWINSWYDPAKEKEAAVSLIESGCDVVTQHCDTAGPTIAAQEAGVFSIGYNSDTLEAGPDAFLTSPVWNHGIYYTDVVKQIIDGSFKPFSYYGNMKDGYVDLLPLSKNAPEGAQAKVDEVKAQIISGDFAPFTGPIKDQSGNIVVEEGKTLTREEIWQINYLVEGAVGSIN